MSIYVDIEKKLGNFFLKVKFEAGDETLALLGTSGCGKSMTLKCIAGIEKPDRGRIVLDGTVLFDSEQKINLPPQARRTGLMFQNYALFPNMTVEQNIYAGTNRETDRKKRREKVAALMERFGLSELAKHLPHQLSGGQQQRVALARILVSDPNVLLLDEPFSALDSHLRFRLEQEVKEILQTFGKTVLLVSHDRDEVFRLCDSVAVMADGQVQTVGQKADVFSNPKTRAAAILTGCKNISELCRVGDHGFFAKDWGVQLKLEDVAPEITSVGIRMRDIQASSGEDGICCQVVSEMEEPFCFTIFLRPKGAVDTVPIAWTVEKEMWQKMRNREVQIRLPEAAILRLKD